MPLAKLPSPAGKREVQQYTKGENALNFQERCSCHRECNILTLEPVTHARAPSCFLCFPLLLHCFFGTGRNKEGSANKGTRCWRDRVLAAGSWEHGSGNCPRFATNDCNQANNASVGLLPAKHKWNFSYASQGRCTALIKIKARFAAQTGMCRWWDKQKHLFYDCWTGCLQTEGEQWLFYWA